jgi:hypothetical protein
MPGPAIGRSAVCLPNRRRIGGFAYRGTTQTRRAHNLNCCRDTILDGHTPHSNEAGGIASQRGSLSENAVRGPTEADPRTTYELRRGVDYNANVVPGSRLNVFPEHTDAVTFWPALIVLTAVPVPPVMEPVIVNRAPVPVGHLPLVVAVTNLIRPFVVPWPAVHVIVTFSEPDFDVDDVKVPPPLPPVADVGVHFDNVITVLLATTFDVNAPHPGPAAAPAGAANRPIDSAIAAANNTPSTLRILKLPSFE